MEEKVRDFAALASKRVLEEAGRRGTREDLRECVCQLRRKQLWEEELRMRGNEGRAVELTSRTAILLLSVILLAVCFLG
jgi:hypothetical protein